MTVIAENEGYNAMFVAWLSPQPMIEHHCYFTGQSFFRVNYSLYLITFCLTLSRHYYIFDFSVFIGTKWPTGVECYNVLAIILKSEFNDSDRIFYTSEINCHMKNETHQKTLNALKILFLIRYKLFEALQYKLSCEQKFCACLMITFLLITQ